MHHVETVYMYSMRHVETVYMYSMRHVETVYMYSMHHVETVYMYSMRHVETVYIHVHTLLVWYLVCFAKVSRCHRHRGPSVIICDAHAHKSADALL